MYQVHKIDFVRKLGHVWNILILLFSRREFSFERMLCYFVSTRKTRVLFNEIK